MGRRSTLNEVELFKAVAQSLSATGSMTLADIVARSGVSSGSLYHRFGSREGLLAAAWLDALAAFTAAMLPILGRDDPNAGTAAAVATPQFCRAHPERAIILACARQSEFIDDATDTAITDAIQRLNESVQTALQRFAIAHGLSADAARLGLVSFPLGAVRQFLPTRAIPPEVDDYVAAAYRATVQTFQSQTDAP